MYNFKQTTNKKARNYSQHVFVAHDRLYLPMETTKLLKGATKCDILVDKEAKVVFVKPEKTGVYKVCQRETQPDCVISATRLVKEYNIPYSTRYTAERYENGFIFKY